MNEKLGNRMLSIDYLKWLPEAASSKKNIRQESIFTGLKTGK